MSGDVRVRTEDRVAVVEVSNPATRNAMDLAISRRLVEVLDDLNDTSEIGAVVVTGEAPSFCAGANLEELKTSSERDLREVYAGFLAVARCPLPTLAAVNGPAVGAGLNLALACDVRLAGPTALFDARFMQLGLHPGGGYTWMAHRAMGPQATAAVTLFGESLDAVEAERVGLVWRRYESDEALLAATMKLAGRAAAAPREVVARTKASMRLTAGAVSHADAVEIEVRAQAETVRSGAFRERVEALQARIRRA
ncbi:enoyl-CoA hydratase-related protein [Jatrophihabitans sp. YIM 134969]